MVALLALRGAFLAIFIGIVYRVYLRAYVELLGIGRELGTLADFPFDCRRINDPDFEACEDMWYDDTAKQIYLACSTTAARQTWLPNMGILNAPSSDASERVVVLDVDKPTGDTYQHRVLKIKNLKSAFFTLSITGKKDATSGKIQFYMVNNKPSIDANTGLALDNTKTGADESIEQFEHTPGSGDLVHVRTFAHRLITTPNNIAIAKDGGMFFTNDHGPHKTGIFEAASMYIHSGTIVHCKPGTPTDCAILSTLHSFPNGILIPDSHPNLLFIASAGLGGTIRIYDILPPLTADQHPRLKLRQKIPMTQPIDNLTYDPVTKSIYAAGIPDVFNAVGNLKNATYHHHVSAPGSVIRLYEEKNLVDGARWVAEKVLEDPTGLVLPSITTVLRDGNGALWTSSVVSPFIAVCLPKRIGG